MRKSVFKVPTREEINCHQRGNIRRSPYIAAHMVIPQDSRYTEYMIDFKVGHLPSGTYCCLGSWGMDYSSIEKRYKRVRLETDWVSAYAGFQKIGTGQMVSIMSFWDVYCTNGQGKESVLQAKILYPKSVIGGGRFGGEGTGTRCIAPIDWKPDHWYRMHLKCTALQETTFVEQWVRDIETGKQTMLSLYDIGIANSAFKGNMCAFLENFLPETAGEVRSMELCNARYLDERSKRWHKVKQVYLTAQGGMPAYEGSYDFGTDGGHVWMITSGVGGDWFNNGKGKKGTYYSL